MWGVWCHAARRAHLRVQLDGVGRVARRLDAVAAVKGVRLEWQVQERALHNGAQVCELLLLVLRVAALYLTKKTPWRGGADVRELL